MSEGAREPDGPDWIQLGAAAELSKRYTAEGREFLQLLVMMLEGALPDETRVERRGSLFGKKSVRSVSVLLGDYRYSLEDPGQGPLKAARVHVVRGIALKTEEMGVEEWITGIGVVLDERARTSAATREALAKLVW